jgi:hypothetical protein
VVAFPSVFDKAAGLVVPDQILVVKGRVDLRGRELQLVALEVTAPELRPVATPGPGEANGSGTPAPVDPLLVDVPLAMCTGGLIGTLKQLFTLHRGPPPVVVRVSADGQRTRLRLGEEYRVDGSAALLAELTGLLGSGSVRLTVEEIGERAEPAVTTPRR